MTDKLRPNLPPLPERIARLPVDERGYPVPWFVTWLNGKPEFRAIDPQKMVAAVQEQRCWICGQILGAHMAFVIGPMCAINRISGEPPSHRDCALFAVQACPFLLMPKMRRRENDLPDGVQYDDAHLNRNPGAILVWMTKHYDCLQRPNGNLLFEIGDYEQLDWYCEGRAATRDEILNSIKGGLPELETMAKQDGPTAMRELKQRCDEVMRMVDESVGVHENF